MEEKINKLIEILKDMPYWKWNYLKQEIDSIYNREQDKSVPNNELETLSKNLNHWCENLRKYKI